MRYIVLIFMFLSCNDCIIYNENTIVLGEYKIYQGKVKEIIIELQSYELGDEWIELSLYRNGILQSSDRQFNTAEFSEAQILTYKFITDGEYGTFNIVNNGKKVEVKILSIKKVL
jgi:hypothetical protein